MQHLGKRSASEARSTRKLLIKFSKSGVGRKSLPKYASEYCENYLIKNEFLAFLRATQSSIARNCERELKVPIRGTVGSMTRFHLVCEEVEQWQACTNGLFLLPRLGSVFCTEIGMPGRVFGVKVSRKSFSSNQISIKKNKKQKKVKLGEHSTLDDTY